MDLMCQLPEAGMKLPNSIGGRSGLDSHCCPPSFVSVSKRSHAIKVCSNYWYSKRMRVRCPTDRLSGIGLQWVLSGWIPSNVPSPDRSCINGWMVLITMVTLLTNSFDNK
jgi:hypothetical protein